MSLLGLPQALRDQIVEYVIPTTIKPHASYPFLKTFKEAGKLVAEQECRLIWPKNPKFWERNCGLLLTNRQLHYDVSKRVQSLQIPITYHLDVLVDHERLLRPTWTYIPLLHNRIDTLTITMRISGSCGRYSSTPIPTVAEEIKERTHAPAGRESGRPHAIANVLRDLILEIFKNGPAKGTANGGSNPNKPLSVNHLHIVVLLPEKETSGGFEVAHDCSTAPTIIGWHRLQNPCRGGCGARPDLRRNLKYSLDLMVITDSFFDMFYDFQCQGVFVGRFTVTSTHDGINEVESFTLSNFYPQLPPSDSIANST
ncbi:uncharacterized protein BDZ99DRAFT_480342 [Mytilinidion resinicola]|uniref:Uncharacterized protein n=1 Tax=Mytilinidion resinicola TaxID=574789 RepID=A0A6A6YCU8_9PEZI|nr:uncharacterized protein BDZ99DRAFT_480342 [Mytilinidion resinicola]KAF2805667.1 hypothetical protein BDZ99DRAFT_480342 [Mytilinidion resinicola]